MTQTLRMALLLLAAAVVASFVASSGPIQWMDNGAFLADATQGHYLSESLGPLEHPLYQFFNSLFYALFGSWLLSLLNSILLLPMAWLIYLLALNVGADRRLALLAATAAVLSHAVFWISTKAEVYIFHSLFVLLAYWIHLDRQSHLSSLKKLFLIGLVTGLGASVHQLTFVVLLPLYIQLLARYKSRVLITLPGFALGFALAWPAIAHDLGDGLNLIDIARRYMTGTTAKASTGGWQGSLFRFDDMWHEKNSVFLLLLSLLGPQLLGLIMFPGDSRQRLLWSAAALNFVFAVSYNVTDRFTFFLPGVQLLCILGILRLHSLLPTDRQGSALLHLSVLTSPVVLLLVYTLYSWGAIRLPSHTEPLPVRNDIHYFMVPYLPDRSAETFIRAYATTIPEGALILADWTPMGALRSAQASGELRGRSLLQCDEAGNIDPYLQGPGAWLVRTSYCAMVGERYALEQRALGYVLHKK